MLPNEASRLIFSTYTENRVKSVFMLGVLLKLMYSKLCFTQISDEMFSLICHRHHQLKISRQTEEMEDGLCCASMSLKTWKKILLLNAGMQVGKNLQNISESMIY